MNFYEAALFRAAKRDYHALVETEEHFKEELSLHVSVEAARAKVEAEFAKVMNFYKASKIKVDELEGALKEAVKEKYRELAQGER